MTDTQKQYLQEIESQGAAGGWVAPLTQEDKAYFAHFRAVCKRYNISPSKATRLEYEFVTRVAESEFYLQRQNVI
jgi:penicillin-binding protein-related factor A (putative recombinase)